MKNHIRTVCIISLSFVLIVVFFGKNMVNAIFDGDTQAVHINPSDVEDSTLIIGTHMIHISSLSDEIYDVAMETAKESGQLDMYYKSELGGGAWFKISEASELADIKLSDRKTDSSVISGLYIRYHTKSDGITYDLLNKTEICIFDSSDPYNLEELSQLESVNIQLSKLESKSKKSDADKKNIDNIKNMLKKGKELKTSNEGNDKALSSLNNLYVKNKNNQELAASLMSAMHQVDSTRRENVLGSLQGMLEELLENIQNADEGKNVNYDLVEAVGSALDEVIKKKTECEADSLQQGNNALSKTKYDIVQNLVNEAGNSQGDTDNNQNIKNLCENLIDIDNITNGIQVNADREKELIVNTLLPVSDDMLADSNDETELKKGFSEGEFLTNMAVSKMSAESAEAFIYTRIKTLDDIVKNISDENLRKTAEVMKEDSVNNLNNIIGSLHSKNDNEMSRLLSEKEKLQSEMKKALDENDLNKAGECEKAISETDEKIDILSKKLSEILASDTASESEKSKARAELGSGLINSQISEFKDDILEEIANGNYEDIQMKLEAIKEIADGSPQTAVNDLKEIYKKISSEMYLSDEQVRLDNLLQLIEEMVSDLSVYLKEQPEEDSLYEIIIQISGDEFDNCSEEEQAAIIAALERYGKENGIETAKNMAAELAVEAYNSDNIYVYGKLKNEAMEFIPLDKIAKSCHYRYVYHEGNKTGILRNGKDYFEYEAFQDNVKIYDSQTEKMDTYARYQSVIYLPKEYVEDKFGITANYIDNSDYGVIVTKGMEDKILNYMEGFLRY